MRVSLGWFSAVALGLVFAFPGTSEAQLLRRLRCNSCNSCNQGCTPGCSSQSGASPDGTEPAPSEMNPELANALSGNEQSNMDFGAASGPQSSTPGMLGDSYIAGAAVNYFLPGTGTFRTIVPYGGRYKCADNTGPVPTNRVSFAYKHFHNALQASSFDDPATTGTISNGHVDSYTLGIEKTFLNGDWSLELRVPFYGGSVFIDTPTAGAGNQSFISSPSFGNLSFIFKTLLTQNETSAIGAGFGVDLPTAEDTRGRALNVQDLQYRSGQTYLAPFISFLTVPNDTWWMQGVVQFSFVAGQNTLISPVEAGGGGGGAGGDIVMNFREQDMVFTTLNVGAWLVGSQRDSGIAAISELNWTATLNNTAVTTQTSGALVVTTANFANEQNIFNLTNGLHFQLSPKSNLRVSAVLPLRAGNTGDNVSRNRYFDSEISVQFNRYF